MSNFPFKLGVTGNSFPLSVNPYWSRVTLAQIQQPAKNYCLLAFKPGLPLQASELNEIQEIQTMENTLFAAMMSSWPTHLPSYQSPIYGPGWNGTTPLYPQFDGDNTTKNMVGYTGGPADGKIQIKPGWYLITVKSSNLKHWFYLDQEYTVNVPPNLTNYPLYLGFTATYKIIKPAEDTSLYDNSSGTTIIIGTAAGADRIKIELSPPFWTESNIQENFSPMAKKQNTEGIVLYMNNVPVPEIN